MTDKDFTKISVTARSLLLKKSITNIPYAKEAAVIIFGQKYLEDYWHKDYPPYAPVYFTGFEARSLSIDKILSTIECKNYLEISSGLSFRGLNLTVGNKIVYIDTDLPQVIERKREIVEVLLEQKQLKLKGTLKFDGLNVLDEETFVNVVSSFPEGPVTIINEGLLIYFNLEEKLKLCRLIYNVLKERGGQWITADIYVRENIDEAKRLRSHLPSFHFITEHQVLENMFTGYSAAEDLFRQCGFQIERHEVSEVFDQLKSPDFFARKMLIDRDKIFSALNKGRETWVLTPISSCK